MDEQHDEAKQEEVTGEGIAESEMKELVQERARQRDE